jgi:hypothetical protein
VTQPENLPRAVKRSLKTRHGCLSSVFGILSLVVLAVPVGLVRSWQSWRRGAEWRLGWTIRPADATSGRLRIDLEADIPHQTTGDFPRRLTETVIRIAEHLRQSDDHYHLIYRDTAEPDAILLPIGPMLQGLGERLILALRQRELADRTAVWLTLPPRPAIAELVDPAAYDPDAAGEPDGLVQHTNARWAMATEWARIGPSTIYHLILWVPGDSASAVEAHLARVTS